ncbi:MAG: NAD-dependent epimerase/dehydratase family protein [Chloroflexi bacterium]|nr:NAD-dependent epimerase/dehydratase family protein [Chloroflexota bacterium]
MATLLTGVGYIGATLVRRLVERGGDALPIVALDNLFSTAPEQIHAILPPGTQLIEGDVADPRTVARAFDALRGEDVMVYHLAAQPSAAIAARDPQVTERSNVVGARVVLEAAHERQARVVFGGSVTYGWSPIMKTTPAFMTVPNLFCQRAARGEVLQVLRDRPMAFIHVLDAAEALLLAGERLSATPTVWQVVNAAPEVATIGQVARAVQRQAEARGVAARIDGDSASEASFQICSRLTTDDGFTPAHSLADGLGEVLDLFLDRR